MDLGTYHQSARETLKRRRHQYQPSLQASKNQEIARRKSIYGWMRVHSFSRFRVLTDAGEQSHVAFRGKRNWEY